MSDLLPPRPPLVVRVGVTGHRDRPGLESKAVLDAVRQSLDRIKGIAQEIFEQNRELFDSGQEDPVLRLVCSLAKGADRLVAREALSKGYKLHAILPFPRGVYVKDPDLGPVEDFQSLLDDVNTEKVFELDNTCLSDKRLRDESYEAAGRLVLRQSDVLIAIWDGKPEEGVGGTGQIVREARAVEIPILHINTEKDHDAILLNPRKASKEDDQLRERLLPALLPPFGDTEERTMAKLAESWFFSENLRGGWRKAPDLPVELHHEGDAVIRNAFEWADNHANHYASAYRRSYRLMYILGALAVLLAYLGSTAESLPAGFPRDHRIYLAAEGIVIFFIGAFAVQGRRRHWHERWLDYRHLAENLRMTRLLVLVGRVSSHVQIPVHLGKGDPRKTWFHFYLRSMVRHAGLVKTEMNDSYRKAFRNLLYENVLGQEKYHEGTGARCHLVHTYGHGIAQVLFIVAALACVAHFWVHGTNAEPQVLFLNLGVIVLPAFAGAIGAILHHGESERIARRSEALEERLEELEAEILAYGDRVPSAQELGRLAEDFSRICLAELMDWRFLFLDRPLVLPA